MNGKSINRRKFCRSLAGYSAVGALLGSPTAE